MDKRATSNAEMIVDLDERIQGTETGIAEADGKSAAVTANIASTTPKIKDNEDTIAAY